MRIIDITVKVSPDLFKNAHANERMAFNGHIGTHFDVMNKEFPLSYTELNGLIFDVSHVPTEQEITIDDIDIELIAENQFVAFHSGFIEKEGYGTHKYFTEHPQLSFELIDILLKKKVAIIGVDFAGVRQGSEHTKTDQRCADQNVFIVENLCNLSEVLNGKKKAYCSMGTYPINYAGQTGLPCRVVARIKG